MAEVQKIDSNATGLRFAEEASIGVLPGTPVWQPLEPNSYDDFGGQITTVARNPINAGRQRQKGVTTDLDASGGFSSDMTQDNFQDILQGFFFASHRTKVEFGGSGQITNVDGTGEDYEAVSGLDAFVAGNLVRASGFTSTANNGTVRVASATAASLVVETTGEFGANLVDEPAPPSAAKLVLVGHSFIAGDLAINAAGNLPILTNAAVAATGILTFGGNPLNNEEVVIGGKTYTFQTALTDVDGNIFIGAAATDSLDNLIAAINLGAGAGTLYAASTTANTDVSATQGVGDTMDATALEVGTAGNAITTTTDVTAGSWGGGNLSSGTGIGFVTLGLIPGEWVFIGGDATAVKFFNAVDNGFARVKIVATDGASLTLDKTQTTMVTDDGTDTGSGGSALSIQLFVGRVLKNEALPVNQVRRTYQLERELGVPDDALPAEIQSEYLVGSVANQITFNLNTADKITADLSFVSIDNEQRTGATGLKSGTRPTLVSGDAFNTSSDFSRLKMAILDPVDSNPTALFAFLTEFTVVINNNVSPNKAISVLGAFEVTAGQFNVEGTATAYFSNVTAVAAVRDNADVTLDFSVVKGAAGSKAGVTVDVPLIALGDARLSVEQDAPITLPLESPAAADRVFNHTLLMMFWDFLPDASDV